MSFINSCLTAVVEIPIGDPSVWAQWGLAGMVVFYTLWHAHIREKRMDDAMKKDHEWIRDTLVTALDRNTAALSSISKKIRQGDS